MYNINVQVRDVTDGVDRLLNGFHQNPREKTSGTGHVKKRNIEERIQ